MQNRNIETRKGYISLASEVLPVWLEISVSNKMCQVTTHKIVYQAAKQVSTCEDDNERLTEHDLHVG